MYHSSLVTKYKSGYIYSAVIGGVEVIKFQVDRYAYIQYVKSYHFAKITITKHVEKCK